MRGEIKIALTGNANVGKSVLFNYLTGLSQMVGNWPGKTVERAEGTLFYEGWKIRVIDLPGTYSLSAYSIEEIIARDYIAIEKPDVVVDVIDASALERNLYLTLQLMELGARVVICLNQIDFARKKGIKIDSQKLSSILGVPVVETIATSGYGVNNLLSTIVKIVEERIEYKPREIRYGAEVENEIQKLVKLIEEEVAPGELKYPTRWLAVKLLERDEEIIEMFSKRGLMEILKEAERIIHRLEEIHGEKSPSIVAAERYHIIIDIVEKVQKIERRRRPKALDVLEEATTHKVVGYIILVGVVAFTFVGVFRMGDVLIEWIEGGMGIVREIIFGALEELGLPPWINLLLEEGIVEGIVAGITIAIPYILPFYIILSILEDSGYLPRAAFLVDNLMHKIGLHGKAFIPMLLGYGCSVPAVLGSRIMETWRERLTLGLVVVLIPCAARTVVILGLVGRYIGVEYALLLYLIDLILVIFVGRVAYSKLPGRPYGLIMEIPPYRMPHFKTILWKTWFRMREFVYIALPFIILGSVSITLLEILGAFEFINEVTMPFTTNILKLPPFAIIPLIFGILRKELTLILLAQIAGTSNFAGILTPSQMFTFSLVTMIYIPCIATIAVLVREYGIKYTLFIIVLDILLATLLGAISAYLGEFAFTT